MKGGSNWITFETLNEWEKRHDNQLLQNFSFLLLADVLTWSSIRDDSVALWDARSIFKPDSDALSILNCFLKFLQVSISRFSSVIVILLFVIFRMLMCFRKTLLNLISMVNRIIFTLCTPFWSPKKCSAVILNNNVDICSYLSHSSNIDGRLKGLRPKSKCEE